MPVIMGGVDYVAASAHIQYERDKLILHVGPYDLEEDFRYCDARWDEVSYYGVVHFHPNRDAYAVPSPGELDVFLDKGKEQGLDWFGLATVPFNQTLINLLLVEKGFFVPSLREEINEFLTPLGLGSVDSYSQEELMRELNKFGLETAFYQFELKE
jgi:hypothetical protein